MKQTMPMTDDFHYSGIMCSLLLPELERIWLPDHSAVHDENSSRPANEPARKLRTPPLILFLEDLPDVPTPGEFSPGKRLPCGHVVSLSSIIDGCNFFGDAIWTPGPHCLGCAEPECKDALEYPKLPDPRVVDGLKARLDLVEWSWKNVKPTKPERNVVSQLRDILSSIGHLSRELEPGTDDEASRPKSSKSPLKQTLVHMEIEEAFGLLVEHGRKSAKIPVRGTEPYCSYRAYRVPGAHSQLLYPMLSPGQECECVTPHEDVREAGSWALTPAETDCDGDAPEDEKDKKRKMDSDDDEPKDQKGKKRKTVRFVAPVVTEVQYFEPWWCHEYRDSDRYWSTGPYRPSVDLSTSADDDWEIELLENPDGSAAGISPRDEDSECGTLVDGDDEEVLGEMDRSSELLDEETLDELEDEVLDELDAGILDDLKKADGESSEEEDEKASWDEIDELEDLGDDCF